jgi:hypothetical protein
MAPVPGVCDRQAMDPPRAAPPRRALFIDDRGAGMRITWRSQRQLVVLSLWHGDVCAATFHMPPDQAARLAGFIVEHLGREAARAGRGAGQGATRSRNSVTDDS